MVPLLVLVLVLVLLLAFAFVFPPVAVLPVGIECEDDGGAFVVEDGFVSLLEHMLEYKLMMIIDFYDFWVLEERLLEGFTLSVYFQNNNVSNNCYFLRMVGWMHRSYSVVVVLGQ